MNRERRRIEKNKREQERVKLLRKAFQELQDLLPNYQKTACTKVQILKDASVYIRYLKLKLRNMEEKTTQDSSDSYQARPSCVFAKVRLFVVYILSKELELFNFHVSAYGRHKISSNRSRYWTVFLFKNRTHWCNYIVNVTVQFAAHIFEMVWMRKV